MSASETPVQGEFRLPEGLATKIVPVAGLIGLVGVVGTLVMGLVGAADMERAAHAYLLNFWYFLTICFGGMFFVLVHYIVGARWSVVVRRIGEIVIGNFPLMALLAIPIVVVTLLGDSSFFRWADPHEADHNELVAAKQAYLNGGFFAIRVAIYFAVWTGLALLYGRASRRQDEGHDPAKHYRLRQIAAPGMIAFAVSLTFASFDFVMSLEPEWFSTIFGVYVFGGGSLAFFSFLAIASVWLEKRGCLPTTVEHYHDIGKFMFGFVVFWSYISFSQYMLIWYANIPEETGWYLHRQSGVWLYLAVALIFGHFVIPFLGLVSRHIKRRRPTLVFWACWLLVMHWIDLYWVIMPSMNGGAHHAGEHPPLQSLPFQPIDFLAFVGFAGLFIAGLFWRAGSAKSLVPMKDPHLPDSLAFKNY